MDRTDLRPSALPGCAEPESPPQGPSPENPLVITTPAADVVQRAMASGRVSQHQPLSPGAGQTTSGPQGAAEDGQHPGSTSTDRPAGIGRKFATWRRNWQPGGDPGQVSAFVAVLLLAVFGVAAMPMRATSRTLRRPDSDELDAIAEPLARIACRHLPMDLLGPDMVDLVAAAKATNSYATAGPLIVPRVTTTLEEY